MSELTLVSAPSQNGRSEEITNIFPAHVGIKKSARKLKLLADFSGAGQTHCVSWGLDLGDLKLQTWVSEELLGFDEIGRAHV